ncbi:MAG: 30S ribosomal protein S4 [Clostridia bacterium]|nr:30S ribosomal protein S4 [Clostridia bacterium]
MATKTPILKRCKALGISPAVVGINKESHREVKRSNKKVSEYGLQLKEKQKAKFIYDVMETPFHNYYVKAEKMKGQAGENLMILLETRLDNVLFRMTFARTRREAKQLINHHFVTVNGKSATIPSMRINAGDVIAISEKYKSSARIKGIIEDTEGRLAPAWMNSDRENLKGTVTALPTREEIDVPVNETLIVELYSK